MEKAGYRIYYKLLNAYGYGVPQTRQRVFFVGIRKDIPMDFQFPSTVKDRVNLSDTIRDLERLSLPVTKGKQAGDFPADIREKGLLHADYPFSKFFMGANRVRGWDQPSFTIVASAKNIPLHPQAPKMTCLGRKNHAFVQGKEHLYRRLSVRECARIQTFPDSFKFFYTNLEHAYRMI